MLDFEVLSCSAYLYTICRDATNTWQVDTPVKPPHDQMLKVWIPLSLFVICLYDGIKPIENLVNIIIIG